MTLRLRSVPALVLALCASAGITVACGDDKGSGDEHSGTEPQVCKDISNACHDLDTGSGPAHDCHEQAHAGDATVCEMIHDECIARCGGGTGTETGTTMTTTSVGESESGTTHADEDTTHGHDTTAAHDESTTDAHDTTAADHGTDTDSSVCDELGTGCHDVKTPEGQECHELGHDGDVAACEKAYEMCAKICGL